MRRLYGSVLAASILIWCGSVQLNATSLIVNGSFETPSVVGGQGWAGFANGAIPGWTSNDTGDASGPGGTEIDYTQILQMPNYAGVQSLEVDGWGFDTVTQTVSGLTPGQEYQISWAYGVRPGSGPQQLVVTFGGNALTTDSTTGNDPTGWTLNTFRFFATGTSEDLVFAAVDTSVTGGNSKVGNELDAVSLEAIPEPATLPLLLTGIGLLAFLWQRKALRA